MKASTARRATAAEWARRVAGWARSGLGAKEYAASIGVSADRLSWWKWYLRTHAARTVADRDSPRTPPVRFLPTRVKDGQVSVATVATPVSVTRAAKPAALEVAFGVGCSVRIEDGCDPEWVGDVMRVIRRAGGAPC